MAKPSILNMEAEHCPLDKHGTCLLPCDVPRMAGIFAMVQALFFKGSIWYLDPTTSKNLWSKTRVVSIFSKNERRLAFIQFDHVAVFRAPCTQSKVSTSRFASTAHK